MTVLVVAGAAAALLWMAQPGPRATGVESAQSDGAGEPAVGPTRRTHPRSDDDRIARLERRIAMLELGSGEPTYPQEGEADEEPLPAPLNREKFEQLALEQEEREENTLTRRLDGEMDDPNWAGELGEQMHRLMSEAGLDGTTIGELRCGQTVCRVELSHRSIEDREPFVHAMMNGLGHYDGWMRNDAQEGLSSRLYIQKTEHGNPARAPRSNLDGV